MSETKYKTFRDLRSVSKEPAKEEKSIKSSSTSISSKTSRPSTPSIAPERDFQRVPNSVTREAMPQGLFRGKSKQVYDYLYHQTRGAVTPKRSVRKSRKEILKGSGLGSMVTVDAAVDHLKNVGLLDVRPAVGSLNGNEYEVFTPEEACTSSTSTTSTTSLTQKVDNLDVLESSSTSITQAVDSTVGYSPPKTSFKTKEKNLDDEAARQFFAKFQQAERELTGKTSTASEKWNELAEVLIAELKIAAGRTTISNVPAFMAEHLRRRLWKLDKKQAAREGKELPDQVSLKPSIPEGQICPDCSNTGWWYPNGTEKGVARCTHLKLQSVPKDEGNA
ncbi:MAG: hypothetical protein LC803_22760 [Acidobacteria bacterium]|nr:hypothetical protein [Acidobacteriota bacterium]